MRAEKFLSTLPARGATVANLSEWWRGQHFYPRSPRGERPPAACPPRTPCSDFYPRSPRGERRSEAAGEIHQGGISIHAPREGSDAGPAGLPGGRTDFYPRSPRGERPNRASASSLVTLFLSTLPARGATLSAFIGAAARTYFYPRSPRGERPSAVNLIASAIDFYPRSPRGERHPTGCR